MLILVRHAPPFRRWHRRLGERLEAAGHGVRFEAAGVPVGRRHLALERRIYRVAADWDAPEPPPPLALPAGLPELTIVLAGAPPAAGLVLQPDVAGGTGEAALLAAARAGTAPTVVVKGGPADATRPLARGRPALEDPRVLARALEDLLPRLVTLLAQAVARLDGGEGEPPPALDEEVASRPMPAPLFLARGLRHKLGRRLGAARGRPDHWRLALRRRDDAAYTLLADDPSCFRADPFPFVEAGRVWLFYEDYAYDSGKGAIGCLAVGAAGSAPPREDELAAPVEGEGVAPATSDAAPPSGEIAIRSDSDVVPAGEARVVLEERFHLSYPLVLRHAGSIYMLPETTAARRLQLYRADPFPDRWAPDAVLIADRRLADATPVLHEGRWWLFAACDDDGGSSWDQLHLFHAPDLFGPWTPHAGNPVLIDAGAARPGGLMWHEGGALMRPAQDCRGGYGDGLVICRVDRLDENGYRQSVVRRMGPPREPRFTGLHTFNRAAGWDVIDLKGSHPR